MRSEKELEKLYKNLKEQETPDLWSRIEAGIETERLPKGEVKKDNVNCFPNRRKRKVTARQIRIMATMAAAIVMIVVFAPVVLEQMNFYKYTTDNAVAIPSETTTSIEKESIANKEGSDKTNNNKGTLSEGTEDFANDNVDREINTDSSVDKEEIVESKKDKQIDNINGDTFEKTETMVSLYLEKVSEVEELSLKGIEGSDLPKSAQKQLKELLEDYGNCKFYKSKTGEVYVQEKEILYLVKGVTI